MTSFVKTDHGPEAAAQGAAAAQAATEQPLHIDWEVLPQAGIHSADAGLEFLGGHLPCQNRRKFCIKLVAQAKP